ACDVFVAPSRYESFGLIFLEAMMFAKPVVGCRAGGMPEVIADGITGLLAEPGDTASLRACLERLVDDPALRGRMGAAGRRRYEERFTPDRMTDALVEFLLAVAQQVSQVTRRAAARAPGAPARAQRGDEGRAGDRATRVALVCSVL